MITKVDKFIAERNKATTASATSNVTHASTTKVNEKLEKNEKDLVKMFGLTEEEASIFLTLLEKVKYSKADAKYVHAEFNKEFPFEGGISFGEALILLAELNSGDTLNEGFFDKVKNKLTGTIEFKVDPTYKGKPESEKLVTSDAIGKTVVKQLTDKGLTPEEAKAAAMYVFDKEGRLGFAKKEVVFDKDSKMLTVKGLGGGVNPNPGG